MTVVSSGADLLVRSSTRDGSSVRSSFYPAAHPRPSGPSRLSVCSSVRSSRLRAPVPSRSVRQFPSLLVSIPSHPSGPSIRPCVHQSAVCAPFVRSCPCPCPSAIPGSQGAARECSGAGGRLCRRTGSPAKWVGSRAELSGWRAPGRSAPAVDTSAAPIARRRRANRSPQPRRSRQSSSAPNLRPSTELQRVRAPCEPASLASASAARHRFPRPDTTLFSKPAHSA